MGDSKCKTSGRYFHVQKQTGNICFHVHCLTLTIGCMGQNDITKIWCKNVISLLYFSKYLWCLMSVCVDWFYFVNLNNIYFFKQGYLICLYWSITTNLHVPYFLLLEVFVNWPIILLDLHFSWLVTLYIILSYWYSLFLITDIKIFLGSKGLLLHRHPGLATLLQKQFTIQQTTAYIAISRVICDMDNEGAVIVKSFITTVYDVSLLLTNRLWIKPDDDASCILGNKQVREDKLFDFPEDKKQFWYLKGATKPDDDASCILGTRVHLLCGNKQVTGTEDKPNFFDFHEDKKQFWWS